MDFCKNCENARKHRDINFLTSDATSNYLSSEPNCYTTNIFSENL